MKEGQAARDRRLLRTYGISAKEYEEMLDKQNGSCAICFKPPKTKRLAVDHDHSYRYLKVFSEDEGSGWWRAWTNGQLERYRVQGWGASKKDAVRVVRGLLKRASVRGLLCYWCNSGLQKFRDNAGSLERAAQYLQRFQERV